MTTQVGTPAAAWHTPPPFGMASAQFTPHAADALSKNDACVTGVCTGVPLCDGVVCAAQDGCHDAGVCETATGLCTNPNAADGTPCDDSDGFTSDDQCQSGACVWTGLCTGVTCSAATCHAPGVCDTATGACGAPIPLTGTACDDGDASTKGDVCSNGTCAGVPLCSGVVCTAASDCRVAGTCDAATGLCSSPPAPDTTACDDGEALTKQDRCTEGACAGVPLCAGVVCDAKDDCHDEGVCDATTGVCTEPVLADSTPCDDGDALTNDDRCEAGECVGFGRCTGVVCTALGPCHVAGTCDTATGACDHPLAASGTLCDDGDATTQGDSCTDGVCAGLPLCTGVVCVALDACHVPGSCDPATGTCSNPTAADGTACDDSDGRTRDDVCETGTCVGVPRCFGVVCTAEDACHVAGTCNGDTGLCGEPTAADGTPCDDSDALTKADACEAGVCSGVSLCTGVECVAADACHVAGSCDSATGACTSNVAADGVSCDDGDSLTKADACTSGVCAGVPLCTEVECVAADACHVAGVCDGATGTCSTPLAPDGVSCDDGDTLTKTDACDTGICVGVPLCMDVECMPLDGCHVAGVCDAATGTCTAPLAADGRACDDGDALTKADACAGGVCVGVSLCEGVVCIATDACHVEGVCDEATGACNSPLASEGTPCDDGDDLTKTDVCLSGACAGVALCSDVVCVAADECHVAGECDPATGECDSPAATDGTMCDDGDACTEAGACVEGACLAGKPLECFAENDCHEIGTCDPATGLCSAPIKDDGAGCDDGEACTSDDHCADGQCLGTAFGCDDGNPCTADSCASDACIHTAQAGACSDGNACTDNDACEEGVCVGTAVLCDDGDPCTTDLCTAAGCTHAPGSGPCDDGDGCTADDACGAGGCAGTEKACDAGFVCEAGECADTQCRLCTEETDCAEGADCVTLGGEGRCLRNCSESETCLDAETCATDSDGQMHCYATDDGPCSKPTVVPSDDVGTIAELDGDVQVGGDVAVNDVGSGDETSDVRAGGPDEGGCQSGASRSSSPVAVLLILATLVLGAGIRRRRRAPR